MQLIGKIAWQLPLVNPAFIYFVGPKCFRQFYHLQILYQIISENIVTGADSIENQAPLSVPLNEPVDFEPEMELAHDYRILLVPSSPRLTPVMPAEGIEIVKLPFSIGRSIKWKETAPTMNMDLIIPDKRPFRLSREHFALYHDQEGCGILDLGSTLGIQINGVFLGRHFGKDFEYLKPGENQVVAGGLDSPFVFKVLVKPE